MRQLEEMGLSKGEQLVYTFLKEESQQHEGAIVQISMDQMRHMILERYGELIVPRKRANGPAERTFSEATVHRAITKLQQAGVIGIRPSVDKAEANAIKFFGIPDPWEQVEQFIELSSNLQMAAQQFKSILESKDREIQQLQRERAQLFRELDELSDATRRANELNDQLQQTMRQMHEGKSSPFDESMIIAVADLEDGTTAYITKKLES
ncbi:hypothetical protein [Paenibacillus sp. UNC496MF]|uniref:hypothetical protein n=1 Tax=Paenibacillus sp. UNC496MF TaxID=1502753 RepID=UPI001C4302A6|nr:hypothetical protein [Paenibacillus sp. UNC496MF]